MKNIEIPSNAENFYLRFTDDVNSDMSFGRSMWITYEDENPGESEGIEAEWNDDFSCYVYRHKGLSGHRLDAETLEAAIAEVMNGNWFGNPNTDKWVIYAGDDASHQYGVSTPEGHDFTPIEVIYKNF